jgi:hypothetical protein
MGVLYGGGPTLNLRMEAQVAFGLAPRDLETGLRVT